MLQLHDGPRSELNESTRDPEVRGDELPTSESIRVVELDTLDRHGGRALMVHLPSTGGRSRVAFVPMKDQAPLNEARRAQIIEGLLAT